MLPFLAQVAFYYELWSIVGSSLKAFGALFVFFFAFVFRGDLGKKKQKLICRKKKLVCGEKQFVCMKRKLACRKDEHVSKGEEAGTLEGRNCMQRYEPRNMIHAT